MKTGLVSVIMPSWNTAGFIAESIRSVIAQTYPDWELIIVDDCSTDNTDDVVKPFLSDPRIRYFKNRKNCGAALTRNKALRKARGEWIAFLDSDDLWTPDKLKTQIRFMKRYGAVFSYHEYEKIDEAGIPLHIHVSGPSAVDRRLMYRYDYIGQLTMMYSAAHFGLIQIKDIKKNNDYAIRLRLFRKDPDAKCLLIRKTLAQYRVRRQSISHDRLKKKLKSHYDLFHFCDEMPCAASLFLTGRNMVFGILKKWVYEKGTQHDPQQRNSDSGKLL